MAITRLPGFVIDSTSSFTFANVTVTGNVSANNANLGNAAIANFFIGDGSLLTGLPAGYSNADVANYLPTYTGNISAGNANLGNAATANFFIGNGSSLTSLAGANVTGQVANALVSGTVYTSEQPNITSTGTLTSLSVTGNVGFIGANVSLGNISNLHISGGTANYVISTDGAGNLAWVEQTGSGIAILPDVIVNSFTANGAANAFTLTTTPASKSFTSVHIDGVYQTENAFALTGNVVSFLNAPFVNSIVEITTFVQGATATTGTVTNAAQPNITSVGTLTSLSVTGNMTTGHIIPSANITYDLGSNTNRFRDLYLSSNTLYLGNTVVSAESILPIDLTIAPEVLAIQASAPNAGDDIIWLFTWEQSTLPFARTKITNSPQNSVPIYRQGIYQFNNFANEQTGNMTQRHDLFFKWIDGSGLDNLVSWAVPAGNVSMSHPDINGNVATSVQRVNVSVPSTIEIPQLVAPNVAYNVSFANAGAYTIGGGGVGENRNIGPLYRGGTYTFNLASSLANHPFYLTTDNGTNFAANTYFGEYTTGVTGSRNNGTTGQTTLTFVVGNSAPSTLFYQCGVHSSMRGAITIRDLAVETNVNGNPIIYLQHHKEGHKTPVEIRPLPSLVNQMCIVYDGTTGKFVPQDLATYVENTPSFKNKIQEVAGTATLVAPDGIAVVPTVSIVEDSSYLPLVGNKNGDITYTEDSDSIYIWNNNAWKNTKAAVPTKYITMYKTGTITTPNVGTSRYYPPKGVRISGVTASMSTASTVDLVFSLLKNGVSAGTYTINANSYTTSASTAANITLTTSDYLTINIATGNGSDLKVDLAYADL